jgi:hypothetical protein
MVMNQLKLFYKKLMNLHHIPFRNRLGAAYVKDFCISFNYIFINCIFIYYNL